MTARQHYDTLLAQYYTWTQGDVHERVAESQAFFAQYDLGPKAEGAHALDLGAGPGYQSIALAHMGYQVLAIDFSADLLKELRQHATGLPVETLWADIQDYNRYDKAQPSLIVCMGDTLTHLEKIQDVRDLIENCVEILQPGGHLVLTFRDYSMELREAERFIPVKLSADVLFTAFLEYEEFRVKVYDIVYERTASGWRQRISWYRKLRLASTFVRKTCAEAGLAITTYELAKPFTVVIAQKPA